MKKTILLSIAALIVSALASAHAERYRPNEHIIIPPPEYDKPFNGALVVTVLKNQEELDRFCPTDTIGCAVTVPNYCFIYLAPDEIIHRYGLTTEEVRRHEIAHCNGWHHPGLHDPPAQQIDPWELKVQQK